MSKYKYKNKVTKAVLETDCVISGGDWVEVKPRKAKESAAAVESEETKAENEGSDDKDGKEDGDGDNE